MFHLAETGTCRHVIMMHMMHFGNGDKPNSTSTVLVVIRVHSSCVGWKQRPLGMLLDIH